MQLRIEIGDSDRDRERGRECVSEIHFNLNLILKIE